MSPFRQVLACAVLTMPGACTPVLEPNPTPNYVGDIEEVAFSVHPPLIASERAGSVLVKGRGDTCGIWFQITGETRIVAQQGNASVLALELGTTVGVWALGTIVESCPGEGIAAAIEEGEFVIREARPR